MLGEILAVTISVADLAPIERAYADYLGYRTVARGTVSADAARAWGAPKVEGNEYLVMRPESGAPHDLRFVVTGPDAHAPHMRTYGWNAVELLAQDPVALAAKLKDSPFQIVGPPRALSGGGNTVAMQVLGPAKELLYLTNPSGDRYVARAFVDRVFIVINGGADLDQLSAFYRDRMASRVGPPIEMRLSVLNRAYGFDVELRHCIAVARLGDTAFSVELDQFPKEAVARAVRPGNLPPGIAMVSFAVADLASVAEPFISPPAALMDAPTSGRRAAVIRGPSGELMELVETGSVP